MDSWRSPAPGVLGDSERGRSGTYATDSETGTGIVQTRGGTLDRIDVSRDSALPSAVAVWSPILALRTFVEPLTSRAPTFWNTSRFNVSFHEPEDVQDRALAITGAGDAVVERGAGGAGTEAAEEAVVVAVPAVSAGEWERRDMGRSGAAVSAASGAARGRSVHECSQPGGLSTGAREFARIGGAGETSRSRSQPI